MNDSHKKNTPVTILLGVLVGITIFTSMLFWRDSNQLSDAYADIMQVEAISSNTQRQINIATTDSPSVRDVFVINESTVNALSIDGTEKISLMSDSGIALLANEVLVQWYTIEELLSVNWNLAEGEDVQALDLNSLGLARDAHFKAMTDLSNGISEHTHDLNSKISQHQLVITSLLFLITMVLINNGLQTRAELMINRELAQKAQIDTATGLYNRSRCQELFKGNQPVSEQRNPAIMVLDLNDLKKTNDKLGHRVGDELIYAFAIILKKACAIHTIAPFIGRYGGDEFIVYYEDVQNEDELKLYLKELNFLTEEHNEKETRFQVSYAVGYSFISKNSEEKLTARQLFDKADEAMYINKEEGKRAKNPNYDEEKAKGDVR